MLYENIEVLEINPVIYIKDKATENWKDNERYVLNELVRLGLNNFGVENPVNDLVYIYFKDKDWTKETELLTEIHNKLSSNFEEVKINLYLDDFIEGEGNTVDLTLDEFIKLLNKR